MTKYCPERYLNTAVSNGQIHQDRDCKPFFCPLSPFSFPPPLSPSLFAELQGVCRGFVLLIHIMDMVLHQK